MSSLDVLAQISLAQVIQRHPPCFAPSTPVQRVISSMSQMQANCVLVMEQQQLLGIFTERDAVRAIATGNLDQAPISAHMTPQTVSVDEAALNNVFSVLQMLRQHQIQYLPVFNQRQVTGLMTRQTMVESLEQVVIEHADRIEQETSDRLPVEAALQQAEQALQQKNQELSNTLQQLRATQAELIQSEKMAALGQLVAGIAHEINTPLGAIRSSIENIAEFLAETLQGLPDFFRQLSSDRYSQFLTLMRGSTQKQDSFSSKEKRQFKRQLIRELESFKVSDSDTVADTLVDMGIYKDATPFISLIKDQTGQKILKTAYQINSLNKSTLTIITATDQAAKMVSALRTYARHDVTAQKVEADINQGIEAVLTLYYNQLKQGIEVQHNFAETLPILCYPDELNQVWTNLIYNALQAMEHQGNLKIDVAQTANQVVVRFTDSGKGISPEIMPKIFDPFFTTKPAGEGSGLGLDIVQKIVKKHQGSITVDSIPGKTTFTVSLPIASKDSGIDG